MSFKAVLAILVCKALRLVSRVLRRGGTAMPGRFALKLCPGLLSRLAKEVKTIVITGTNGKTTSARMVEEALNLAGLDCFANRSGANLIDGITTEFVMNASITGKPKKKYAVIECDEFASKKVFPQLKPAAVLVTNLFNDQVERYGGVTGTLAGIREALTSVPETTLCLNADCSVVASLGSLPNPHVFYGLDEGAAQSRTKPEKLDAASCLSCGTDYEYTYLTYDHLGGFYCPKCGYRRPDTDFAVTAVISAGREDSTVSMRTPEGEHQVYINLPAVYNMYNAAGTMAAVSVLGVSAEVSIKALAQFSCGFGRMEHLKLGRAGAEMMLVKNPAGTNQVIDYITKGEGDFALVIAFNARPSDGTGIEWINDCDFEKLAQHQEHISTLIVSGEKVAQLNERLLAAGIDPGRITLEGSYSAIVKRLSQQDKPIYLMPNYTVMLELRQEIVRQCGGSDFWE